MHPTPILPARPKRIGFFVACLTDSFYPQVGVAVVKILERLGYAVEFPDAQTCCGQPFFNNGYMPEARRLASRMIEVFEPFDAIVTPSGSCCAMVREQFHELFHDDPVWNPRMEALRNKTFEFVEFVTRVHPIDLSQLTLREPTRFTFHYTCHQRGIGMRDEAVEILRKLGNVDFVPMDKSDQCCGFGGTFAIKYPAISRAMVDDKITAIRSTGAARTICNDAGCTMNIAGMCSRAGVKTDVTHLALVLAEAMGIDVQTL